ncbi:MAG: HAMP domain-containing sensor histidine kinase [Acidimicrobiaceae bacterium]|nr:HAMP domain-containing sensor histidine kinase [Acidimicrobiaceae bacterium]
MSLRWRILGATTVVVVLAVLTSVGVAYYATQSRLDLFVGQIGEREAHRLAQGLSRAYTDTGGWGTALDELGDAGFGLDSSPGEPHEGGGGSEGSGGSREGGEGTGGSEGAHVEFVRVVITDVDGLVVLDNASELAPGSAGDGLGGHPGTVIDLATGQTVGHVRVDTDHDLLSSESHGFLSALLYITLIGALVTAAVAMLIAAWLSKRITAPVRALTRAAQGIARGSTSQLPVTSSDELGQMTSAFNQMSSDLDAQRALRRRLVDEVSHELNTPLSVIQLEAAGLRDGLGTPERVSGHIIDEVTRLRGLVTDLNSLAETELGELSLAPETVGAGELLETEFGRWLPQAEAAGVSLSLDLAGDLPDVHVDRMRMSQTLGNVLRNAMNSTPAGGSIVVAAARETGTDPDQDSGTGAGAGMLAISVIDDGIGIGADDLPQVFERFYRAEHSREAGTAGTGLGLAISRAIVEAHGGTIDVASEGLERGVTVTIHLPCGPAHP